MVYLSVGVTLLCAAFLVALTRFALSPQQAIYLVLGRVTRGRLGTGWLFRPASRQRTFVPGGRVVHTPYVLRLNTYDGSGQCVHPDVVCVERGIGSEQWRYWMAVTPYPFGQDEYENPSVFASHDGLEWRVPKGLRNPIIAALLRRGEHNSDPCLLFCCDRLWLYFRQTTLTGLGKKSRLCVTSSEDGVTWTDPTEVVASESDTLISPSIVFSEGTFTMWTVNASSWPFGLVKRVSTDGLRWKEGGSASLTGFQPDRCVWHFQTILDGERLHALFVSCAGPGGTGARLHYGQSADSGESWVVRPPMLPQSHRFEEKLQYRGCLLRAEGHANLFEVWYSGISLGGTSTTVYLPMVLMGDNLLPLGSLEWKKRSHKCHG